MFLCEGKRVIAHISVKIVKQRIKKYIVHVIIDAIGGGDVQSGLRSIRSQRHLIKEESCSPGELSLAGDVVLSEHQQSKHISIDDG